MDRTVSKSSRMATSRSTGDSRRQAPSIREGWAVLNALPDMCFVVGGAGMVHFANDAAGYLLGVAPEAMQGKAFKDLLTEPYRSAARLALNICSVEGTPRSLEAEFPSVNSKHVSALLHVSQYPAHQEDGWCLVVARDISKDREKELDLLRFTNVAHYTVNPLEITDTDGKIVWVNPAFEKASGYSRDELIGQKPAIFGSGKHPKSFWANMWQTITAGRTWVGEVENKRRNGEAFFTQILISPIVDRRGAIVGYFGIHRDITHQRYLEQQLMHAQKMESIGMLAAGLAHEVGNPLTSISSIVQVIQRTTTDEFAKDKLGLIKSQINRISRIIRELVDFARQSTYEVVMTDVNRTINDAIDIVRVGKKTKDIGFHVQLDPALPHVPLVPDKVQQVIINILINAVDAMQDRPLDRKAAGIVVRSSADGKNVVITIQDSGSGIPADAIPKIFDPFFTTKAVGEGTGLGLWVSYTIVKSFEGDIRVESTEDEGTTFMITFPQHSSLT